MMELADQCSREVADHRRGFEIMYYKVSRTDLKYYLPGCLGLLGFEWHGELMDLCIIWLILKSVEEAKEKY
jgi:hypothetical protein